MTFNKSSAINFLNLVTSGKIDEAYEKYVDMKGKHHNLFFPAGFPALRKAMKESDVQFPKKKFAIKNVFGEGDLIATHSHVALKPGELEVSAVHMFRFEKGKIVEMWDVGQEIPKNLPNKDGAF